GVSGRFTLNLKDPDAAWTMAGSLELGGFAGFYTTRVDGSAMIVTGGVTVETGLAQIDSAVEFRDGSALVIESEHAALRLRGGARFAAGAEFHGDGTLRNGANATMTLDDGVDLDGIGLTNDG